MAELRDLGLFPLDLVLLPGERLPLHLFEPRYRQLYADCVLGDLPFVLIRAESGETARVGCAARFEELVQRSDDGRLHVVVRGVEPVEVVEETEGALYFSAMCRTLTDAAVTPDPELQREVRERFRRLAERVAGAPREPEAPAGVPLSYAVGGAVELHPGVAQGLLETRDENARLGEVRDALDAMLAVAERATMAAARAKTNGRVPH
ncbi:MAG TPA: LON peptidase substrate-binding domain-containing protein [Miltoncostaeaceae bacterium]|nr:LON peptidase substrate-binding domain-containing protein [Miltoncostaeaceae bacterium]